MRDTEAERLIREKYAALGRLPQKSDFSPAEVMSIKETLGPWPRALERAGVKPPSPVYERKQAKKRQGISSNGNGKRTTAD
jgi:hypothetical protein